MPNSPKSRDKWKKIVELQLNSGLAPSSFCEREQVNIHRFYYCRGILFPRAVKKSKKSSAFIPVRAQEDSSTFIVLEVGTVNIRVKQTDLDFIVMLCRRLNSP